MESLKRFFRKLVTYFYVPPVVCIILSLGACGSIIYDLNDLGIACMLLSFVLLAIQVVVFVAALFQRRWLIAIISLLALVITATITFLSVIGIAVGQHHPPHYGEVDSLAIDSLELDSLAVDEVDTNDLPDSVIQE